MKTEHLRALLTTAKLGSIRKAGQALHINQQQLSKIIQSLETEFGCPIFERSPKGVSPTPCGQDILHTTAAIITQLDALSERLTQSAERQAANALTGTLTIHAPVNAWPRGTIVDILDEFTSVYPAILVQFDELSPSQIIAALLTHPEHIGLIVKEKTHIGTPLEVPSDLTFLPLYVSKMVAFAGAESAFAQKHQTTSLKALQKEAFVLYRPDINAQATCDLIFAPIGGYNLKYSVSSQSAFYDILRKGKAISVGVHKDQSTLQQGISIIPIRDNILVESGLLIHKSARKTPLVQAFCAFYLSYFQS